MKTEGKNIKSIVFDFLATAVREVFIVFGGVILYGVLIYCLIVGSPLTWVLFIPFNYCGWVDNGWLAFLGTGASFYVAFMYFKVLTESEGARLWDLVNFLFEQEKVSIPPLVHVASNTVSDKCVDIPLRNQMQCEVAKGAALAFLREEHTSNESLREAISKAARNATDFYLDLDRKLPAATDEELAILAKQRPFLSWVDIRLILMCLGTLIIWATLGYLRAMHLNQPWPGRI
jgi:hypothetical protein